MAVFWGGAGGRAGAYLNLQILQEHAQKFCTPRTPCGASGSQGFAPAAGPARVCQLEAGWLAIGWLAWLAADWQGWPLAGWGPAAQYDWEWVLNTLILGPTTTIYNCYCRLQDTKMVHPVLQE